MQNYKLYQLNIEKLLKNRSDNDILNDIFDLHNEDDRPNRHRLRSCSVSDVIVLDSKDDGRAYTVLVLGFRPVDFN